MSFMDSKDKILVEIESNALGDTIGAISVIEKWRNITNKSISVYCKFTDILNVSYPMIHLFDKEKYKIQIDEGGWIIDGVYHSEKINTTYKFDIPLLDGYAKDFGIDSSGLKMKVDLFVKERPIKSKYVCIGTHSTSQCKLWNYPGGWDDICKYFRKKGLTPVCIDRYEQFGVDGFMNPVPSKSVKRIGMSLEDIINYIYHSEMFIGLSSGLAWVSQGLDKPTVIISNSTSKDNEFIDNRTLRIYDESICHGCFHKYAFNPGDWLWCPVYRNDDDRRFICSKAITPEVVMEKISKFYNI